MPLFQAEDAELFYEDTGRGEPVVLLHGLGGSSTLWEPQIAALAPHYRVLAFDTRGSGRSRDLQHRAGPFSVKQFANDVARLLDHLGAVPSHIVGVSMGGMIAFQFAVDHPHYLRTLTVVNSVPAVVLRTLSERVRVAQRLLMARLLGPAGVARLLAPRLFPGPEHSGLRRHFIDNMSQTDKGAYIATQRAFVGWSVLDRIGAIDVPVLVVASENDFWSVADKEIYARRMQRSEVVVVADAGHALPLEKPEPFNRLLTAFLERSMSSIR